MKYKSITEKEKAALALYKEMGELYQSKHRRPSIKLDKPYQKGWKRFFKVRDDIARSPYGKMATRILGVVQHTDYSSREDFKKKGNKSKKLVEVKAGVRRIPIREWNKNKYPEEWRRLFTARRNRYGDIEYHFDKPWWFESVVEKHMITHYYEADADLDERLKEINQIIQYNKMEAVYYGMRNGRDRDDWGDPDAKDRVLRNEAKKEIRENL